MTAPTPDSCRKHPGLDVVLLYRPIGLVRAVAHWISEDVMHVDTGVIVLEPHNEVEITFAHSQGEHTVFHRIIAYVSDRVEGITQLHFVRCSHDAYQALREVMATGTA